MKRPAIPWAVKLECVLSHSAKCAKCGEPLLGKHARAGQVHFDHRPPLAVRARTINGDHVPAANDPDFIQPLHKWCHSKLTYGGDAKATTQNSDAHTLAHGRRIVTKRAKHEAALAEKAGGKPVRRTGSIPSRPFRKKS